MLLRNLALIGCGRWGKNLAQVFDHLGVLHTICDLNYQSSDSHLRITQDIQQALDSKITRVAIATPSKTHFDLIQQALDAGKDVFVEKPMCLNTQEAQCIFKKVESSEQILMVGHLLRYHPCFLKLQNLVSQGAIGNIQAISATRLSTEPAREEGILLDLAVHDVSMALALSDALQIPQIEIFTRASEPIKQQILKVVGDLGELVFDDLKPWRQKLRLGAEYIEVKTAEPLELECRHFLEACETRSNPKTDTAESCRILEFIVKRFLS